MVEFALVAPILFLLMFAVFQGGVLYFKYQQVGFAASEAARCAAVARNAPVQTPACAPTAASATDAATKRAIAQAPNLDLTADDVTVSSNSGWALPGRVKVTITHATSLPIFGTSITLTSSSSAKLER